MTCLLCHPFRRRACVILCREFCVAPKKSWWRRHIVADAEDSWRYDAIDREIGEGE